MTVTLNGDAWAWRSVNVAGDMNREAEQAEQKTTEAAVVTQGLFFAVSTFTRPVYMRLAQK